MKIVAPIGANKNRKRIGRGSSSGVGKTSGRGQKGQKARNTIRPGFEGGQMPLYRRIARRGFSNIRFRKNIASVNLLMLSHYFLDGEEVTLDALKKKKIVKRIAINAKILAKGEIDKKLTIKGLLMSATAEKKLQEAGCTLVPLAKPEAKEVAQDA